jgi:sulfotransferase family protein
MSEQREVCWKGSPVRNWAEFHRVVKRPGNELLSQLDEFGDSILVSGCQRSGTTALTHALCESEGLADYAFGRDSELDGALLLAGSVLRFTRGRHCFQTTYLNDRFAEYLCHDSFRLVWVLREPRSVVYSMLHNWKRAALNRLYSACGNTRLDAVHHEASFLDRWVGPSRLDKACASYVAKTEQAFLLRRELKERMLVIDYDELVVRPDVTLRHICEFVDVPFDPRIADRMHGRSSRRGDRLASWQASRVDNACAPVYRAALTMRPEWRLRDA